MRSGSPRNEMLRGEAMTFHSDPVHEYQESEAEKGRLEKRAADRERFGEKVSRYSLNSQDLESARLVARNAAEHFESHSIRVLLGAALLAARKRGDKYAAATIQDGFNAVFESLVGVPPMTVRQRQEHGS